MERIWTADQQKAIDTHGADILVSAAAGSGKTAVLTERVIKMLCDEENGCDISRLLIVTFTKLAAEELRSRIRKGLQEKLSTSPSRHLRKQLAALPNAKISTVHSFCFSLIKENAASLSLPAGLRIADDVESDLLTRYIIDEAIYDAYEKKPPFDTLDFERICDNFLRSKTDESLNETFMSVYKTALNSPRHLSLLTDSAEMHRDTAKNGFANSKFFDLIQKRILSLYTYLISEYKAIFSDYADDEAFTSKYLPTMSSDVDFMEKCVCAAQNRSYAPLSSYFNSFKAEKLSAVRGECDFKARSAELRDLFKDSVIELKAYFGYTDEEIRLRCTECAEVLDGIYLFLSEVDRRLSEEKKDRKILDFSDLEHYACKLLFDFDNNRPTALARQVSSQLYEVMVDEYQDTNELQDLIFSSIGEGKRFMVGDIKQSIYGFRGAVPQIFADYREKFVTDDKQTIFFSSNFRCSHPIIELTNNIFSALFSFNESVPYRAEDALVCGKSVSSDCGKEQAELILIEQSPDENRQAVWVAEKISDLLKNGTDENGKKYKPSDFAIIMRSIKENSEPYENELRMRGIPVYNSADGNFFDSPEIEIVISLLSVIDNPMDDIYLAAVMKSPLFGFSLDELIVLRGERSMSMYDSVKYSSKNGNEKCTDMLAVLSKYRYISRSMPVDKFISFLYRDMNIIELLSTGEDVSHPEITRANLRLLHEYSRSYEQGSFKGLYNFVSYLHDVIQKNKVLAEAKPADGGDLGVRILTVHKSKGLEFPVCFICGCNKQLSVHESKNPAFSRNYLFASKIKDSTGLRIHKLPTYSVVQADNADSEFYDETRVLYVALTRARQKLFVCAEIKKCREFLEKNLKEKPAAPCIIRSSNSIMAMILRSLCIETCPVTVIEDVIEAEKTDAISEKIPASEFDTKLYTELKNRLDYVYPHKKISDIPKKVSVSKLYPDFLDKDETSHLPELDRIPFVLPELDIDENISAAKGTATHVFMQFCNMKNAHESVEHECQRLVAEKYMPEKYIELIYKNELRRFFAGDLYSAIISSPEVHREYRFNIGLPAALFSSDPEIGENETLYVQGVIDCFFLNPDGTLTVVDYKTDRLSSKDPDSAAEFIERHKNQLKYYSAAIEYITNRKVSKKILYSFCLSTAFEVSDC